MKKLSLFHIILKTFLLFIVCISLYSCIKKEDDVFVNAPFDIATTKKDSVIDFNLLKCLDESNQKTIELSGILFDLTIDVKTLQLLVQIRKNHNKMNAKLNNLAKKNLILLPNLFYHADIIPDSVKSKKGNLYLIKIIQTELKNQITIFDKMDKTSKNIDMRIFAIQFKKNTQENSNTISNIIKTLQ